MPEKLLTIREASSFLGVSEEDVKKLVAQGELPAYKIGGEYLRFRREQIVAIKDEIPGKLAPHQLKPMPLREQEALRSRGGIGREYPESFGNRFLDFFYFNDFYIIAVVITFIILWFILK